MSDSHPEMIGTGGGGLALVGYRGTGKSTVGRLLADRLRRPFVDADDWIVERSGRTIRAIFEESGEPVFRDWEERVLREILVERPDAVVATGGGAVLREANRRLLQSFGLVVWLRAEPDELARRLEADAQTREARPSLTSAGTLREILDVLEVRTPLYRAVSHVEIDTQGKTPSAIVEEMLTQWSRVDASRSHRGIAPCS